MILSSSGQHFPAIPPGKTKLNMKTLTENELGGIEGGSGSTPSWPLQPYSPPVVRMPPRVIDPDAIVPSYLQG